MTVEVFESALVDGKYQGENGSYENGYIRLDINAGKLSESDTQTYMMQALSHEMVHSFEGTEAYSKLSDFVFSHVKDKDAKIQSKLSRAEKAGKPISRTEAELEVVADACEEVLQNSKYMEELYKKDRTTWQKIKDWFKNAFKKIRKMYDALPATHDEAKEMRQYMDKLTTLYEAAFKESMDGEKVQKNTAETGGKEYSIRPDLADDLTRIKNRTFPTKQNEVLIGTTSDFLVNILKAPDLFVLMPPTKAYRAMVTEEEATAQGQPKSSENIHYHGLGVNGLMEAIRQSENPIAAFAEPEPDNGKFANRICLVTGMKRNGSNIVVFVDLDDVGNIGGKIIRANKDVTVYDDNRIVKILADADATGRMLYYDKKRSSEIAGGQAKIWPDSIRTSNFDDNIKHFWENVKWKKDSANGKAKTEYGATGAKTTVQIEMERAIAQKNNSELKRQDREYLALAENPEKNRAELERMVEEAAKAAGYNYKVYHGTQKQSKNGKFPFTVFKGGVLGTIYTATNRKLAEDFSVGYQTKGIVYDLYAKLDNPLVVNEHVYDEVPWYHNVPVPSKMKEEKAYKYFDKKTGRASTEEIAVYAHENGYDGVIIEGIREGSGTQTDDIIVFDSNLLKSADPVTYDDSGNIIPLSERFNSDETDIRYQEREETISDRDLLATAAITDSMTEGERSWLTQYKQKVSELSEKARELSKQKQLSITETGEEKIKAKNRADILQKIGRRAFLTYR